MSAVRVVTSRRDAEHRVRKTLPAVTAVVFWLVLPLLCLLAFGVGADRLASHLDNVPAGTKGTYLVTSHDCRQELCITGGTFTSADGTIVQANLLGDYRWRLGKTYQVVYASNASDVIPLPARWDPTSTVVGLAAAVGVLLGWAWCVRSARRRARGTAHAA